MTVPQERKNAVIKTEQFLLDLLDPKVTPRIPKSLRIQAHHCLRHYPSKHHMDIIAEREDNSNMPIGIKVFGNGFV
jgi:hypothetical protein